MITRDSQKRLLILIFIDKTLVAILLSNFFFLLLLDIEKFKLNSILA